MEFHNNFKPLIEDVRKLYKALRRASKGREEAIRAVKEYFTDELEDFDDRLAVWIGLTLALCEKKELTKLIAKETCEHIRLFRQSAQVNDSENKYLLQIESLLGNDTLQGEEAKYRIYKPYAPDWKVGDLFAHTLTYPGAEAAGILGWTVLFYKIGEYQDMDNNTKQLMCISLCPPGMEPASPWDLQQLGFLRMMKHDNAWDYIAKLSVKSKRTEKGYEFTKIGNFPGIIPPADCTAENPLYAMPIFGYLAKDDICPAYESQICLYYRQHGLNITPDYGDLIKTGEG